MFVHTIAHYLQKVVYKYMYDELSANSFKPYRKRNSQLRRIKHQTQHSFGFTSLMNIGVAHITQVTHMRIKIVTFKGGHLM